MTSATSDSAPAPVVLGQLLTHAVIGGAENLVVQIANAHAEAGNDSHVIVLSGPGPLSPRFSPSVTLHYLGFERKSIRNPVRFLLSVWRGFRLLDDAIQNAGIQVLQTHLPATNLWGLSLSLLGRVKVVVTVHSNRFLEMQGGTSFGGWVRRMAYRLMARHCGRVVAVSAKVKDSLIVGVGLAREDADRVVVVENGVTVREQLSDMEPGRSRCSRQPGIGNGSFLILAAGRLCRPKNFSCLIRAARDLKGYGADYCVLIAGEGEERPMLTRLIEELDVSDIVTLAGSLDNLDEVMATADILAMPSLWEGLPFVLLEAMAKGVPVVGTRVPGIADIVVDGTEGLLVEADDHQALAQAVASLHDDAELRYRLGHAGHEKVCRQYNFADKYRQFREIYEDLTSGSSGNYR